MREHRAYTMTSTELIGHRAKVVFSVDIFNQRNPLRQVGFVFSDNY